MSFGRVSILLGQLSDSSLRLRSSVAIGTVLFGLFGYAVDSAMTQFKVPDDIHAGMVGAVVGLGAGLSFWVLLVGLRERRILLTDEIHRLAELNHTVRNSLDQIVLAHYSADEQHKRIVLESTARIDEKLKELFPVVGTPGKWQKKGRTSMRGPT
jgi:hypothetical protein